MLKIKAGSSFCCKQVGRGNGWTLDSRAKGGLQESTAANFFCNPLGKYNEWGEMWVLVCLWGQKHARLGDCWPFTLELYIPPQRGQPWRNQASPTSATPCSTLHTWGRGETPLAGTYFTQATINGARMTSSDRGISKVGHSNESRWILLITSESQFLHGFSPEATQLCNSTGRS